MIYDWPADASWTPDSGIFRLRERALLSSSPYTGAHKASSLAQLWVARLKFPSRILSATHDMQGFLDALEGPVNPVRMFDHLRLAPVLLSGGSSPFSDGSYFTDGTGWTDGYEPMLTANVAQGANFVAMDGLPASTECFRRGDLIGIGGYLYELKHGGTTNSSGAIGVTVQPGLRLGAAADDPVTLYRPTVPMRLATDIEAAISRSYQWGSPFELAFVEDIP